MGVIHKFKKEVTNYIIEKKKKEPAISCRELVSLVQQEFNKTVSKSSINSVIRVSGLSMPVGRRRVLEQDRYELKSTGIFFLKAADWLLGGSLNIAKAVNKYLRLDDQETLNKIEYLIYGNLGIESSPSDALLFELSFEKELCQEIARIISELSKETGILKLNLADKSVVYLDGQSRAVWSSAKIPSSFSTTYYDADRYIKKIFFENNPLVLFMSPGYDAPTKEFFDFISFLDGQKSISSAVLLDSNLTEIETINPQEYVCKQFIVFGIWPWQFGQCREIKSIGEFKPFHFIPTNKNYYIAETTIELSRHNENREVILSGCVLKKAVKGKEILSIYTNLAFERLKPEEIAAAYLNKWPNLEEGFVNFSRNIENFSREAENTVYSGNLKCEEDLSVKKLLELYLMILDSFVRLNFLPDRYKKDDFLAIKNRFYDLKGVFSAKGNEVIIKFRPPLKYPNIKELEYACSRVNERNVFTADGKKLWLMA